MGKNTGSMGNLHLSIAGKTVSVERLIPERFRVELVMKRYTN